MAKVKESTQTLGSVLSFRRAVQISDASMHNMDDSYISAYVHGMRTSQPASKSKKAGEVEKSDGVGNLSVIEMAKLNTGNDILKVKFQITVLPISISPEMSDSSEKKRLIEKRNQELLKDESLDLVSKYYAYNIINASWGWRNRISASAVKTTVKVKDITIEVDDAHNMSIYPVLSPLQIEAGFKNPLDEYSDKIEQLAQSIKKALLGETSPINIDVEGEFKLIHGGEVFPSQIFNPNEEKTGDDKKSKIGRRFFKLPFSRKNATYDSRGYVGITSEKINNSLRRFDLLQDGAGEYTVIAIEPSGSDATTREAYRKSGKNLLSLYSDWLFKPESEFTTQDKVFIIGMLIRGGLFNEASDKEK